MHSIDHQYFRKIENEFNELSNLSRSDALRRLYATQIIQPVNIDYSLLDDAKLVVFQAMQHLQVLDSLDAWLIGSCLDCRVISRDIDVLFTPRYGCSPPKISEVAKLFWVTVKAGAENLKINFDLMFRYESELISGGELDPEKIISTWLLEWPIFKKSIKSKAVIKFRRVGLLSMVITKKISDTSYYSKLHLLESGKRYLRPAKRIVFDTKFCNLK